MGNYCTGMAVIQGCERSLRFLFETMMDGKSVILLDLISDADTIKMTVIGIQDPVGELDVIDIISKDESWTCLKFAMNLLLQI
jgi:hypothetical protein